MNNYSFTTMPSVSISRSRFRRTSSHKTSFNLGDIIPVYCDEVLPGDTRSLDLAALIRMSQPIAPIMDNIVCDFFAFFIPNRIVWDHWRDFLGENNVSAGIPSSNYVIPTVTTSGLSPVLGSYCDYFGLPVGNSLNVYNKVSALPFRALAKTYNRWFRNENVIAPLAVDTSDLSRVLVSGTSAFIGNSSLLKAAKIADYFTSALPYAQKGLPVKIPLGGTADIKVLADSASTVSVNSTLTLKNTDAMVAGTPGSSNINVSGSGFSVGTSGASGLIADLSNATAATINQLRYAFQLQKMLEKDALYGTKYWSILAAHFGVDAPDASIQDPEYLGGKRMHISVDQVLQTTGFNATPGSNTLGTPGANSVSGFKGSLFTKSFVEHGTLLICMVARQESHTYSQGINRMWTRSGRYDFYWPVFANLGAQSVLKKEIYFGASDPDGIFGYQEAWAEYRFKPSIATGLLNPSRSGSLNYWTLSENFTSEPTLGQTFIEEDRSNLARALVTGATGPDFIADIYFVDVAVRPMPTYSIPGLIDHH